MHQITVSKSICAKKKKKDSTELRSCCCNSLSGSDITPFMLFWLNSLVQGNVWGSTDSSLRNMWAVNFIHKSAKTQERQRSIEARFNGLFLFNFPS